MRLDVAALLGLLTLTPALAADLTLYLPTRPNPFTLPPTTHATLATLGESYSAPLSAVNTFVFRNVSAPGSYLADVHCQTDAFQPLRIDIDAEGGLQAWQTFRGNEWDNKGEALAVREGSVGKGVELKALGGKNYFAERPAFSVLTILKNPMILMGGVSMLLFIGMPYLMDNMDPELKAEFEQRQKEGGGLGSIMGGGGQQQQNPLGNFDMAAYLAGSGKKESSAASSGAKNNGQKNNNGVRR